MIGIKKQAVIVLLAMVVMASVAFAADILDNLDTTLTDDEKTSLAATLSPLGVVIAIGQFIAGLVAVLMVIYAGFVYYKGDPQSKQQALQKLGAVIIGAILIFGATTIVRILGIIR